MNLDKLTIDIRPRRPWEAVDLGTLMARRWWPQLFSIWLIMTLPIFFLLSFLPAEYLLLQGVILWWLKPLFERPLLYVLSRTVFGEFPSTREALKAAPKLAVKQLFMSLLWRRLSLTRSFDLPVIQLEGLKGKQRSDRLTVLHREGVTPATALTIFIIHIQQFLALSVLGLVAIFVPPNFEINWYQILMDYENNNRWVVLVFNFIGLLCSAAVAPFFVASGFSLYLNRRVKLEAWDVEIAFKRMVQRREESSVHSSEAPKTNSKAATISLSIVLASAFFISQPTPVQAEDDLKSLLQDTHYREVGDPNSAQEVIKSIKKLDAFNTRETISKPIFEREVKEKEQKKEGGWLKPLFDFMDSIKDFVSFLASAGQWVLWLIVFGIIGLLVYRYRDWIAEFANLRPQEQKKFRPEVMFGMEVTKESLPDDVGAAALNYWNNGEGRKALALLYRASLAQLLEFGVDFSDGDTEAVCVEKAKRYARSSKLSERDCLSYFELLTREWQRFAYGHISPQANTVESLCTRWSSVWKSDHHDVGAADVE